MHGEGSEYGLLLPLLILLGATVFSLSFQAVDGSKWVEHLLTGLPGGQVGFLIVVNVLVFFLAFFLDFFELAFIIVPLLAPAADKLGISADLRAFVASCASGKLANVSYVDPNFDLNSDHPHQDIRDGETFLNTVYNAVTTSPAWPKTLLMMCRKAISAPAITMAAMKANSEVAEMDRPPTL